MFAHTRRGFTLIELLVVVAIIGIFASTAMASYSTVLETTRDGKRAAAMREVQKALAAYYLDNGHYPDVSSYPTPGHGFVHDCSGSNLWGDFIDNELRPYLNGTPHDELYPDNPWPYCFMYKAEDYPHCSGTDHGYILLFVTENSFYDHFKLYAAQGEGNPPVAGRYCLHPDE